MGAVFPRRCVPVCDGSESVVPLSGVVVPFPATVGLVRLSSAPQCKESIFLYHRVTDENHISHINHQDLDKNPSEPPRRGYTRCP